MAPLLLLVRIPIPFRFAIRYLKKRNRYSPASREEQADLLNANDVPLAVLAPHLSRQD
jgi:hypothetical protein